MTCFVYKKAFSKVPRDAVQACKTRITLTQGRGSLDNITGSGPGRVGANNAHVQLKR